MLFGCFDKRKTFWACVTLFILISSVAKAQTGFSPFQNAQNQSLPDPALAQAGMPGQDGQTGQISQTLPAGSAGQNPSDLNTPQAAAPIVPQQDGTEERPMPAPFVLTQQEQAQTDSILKRWEQFSMGIHTFETDFTRIMYRRSLENAKYVKTQEKGEMRYESPDHGMFVVRSEDGSPSEKWICDGKYVFEFKYAQKQIDQYTLPPEMRGKRITQGPLPFLFGASAEELKNRYYIRHILPDAKLARPGQVWLEAYPKKSDDASEFQRAEMIISFGNDVRPLAIKLFKANQDQYVYIFDLKEMKVNKTQILPSNWAPSVPEKMRMKIVPVD